MSTETFRKNCLIFFRNKKSVNFERENTLVSAFSDNFCRFEKIEFVTYDSSEEIVRAVKNCQNVYDNIIFVCPKQMEESLKNFISSVYGGQFDENNVLQTESKRIFLLFSDSENRLNATEISARILKDCGKRYERAYIKTVCAPVEVVNAAILGAKKICDGLEFCISDSYGDTTIEITYPADIAKSDYDKAYRALLGGLKDYVYALENVSLAERLIQLLKLRRMKVCVAESFTGGGVCKRLVEVSGVSEVFFEGLNTYSNESKHARLGVKEITLKHYGAVSDKCAYEMAEGLLGENCDISIATTGIAGPKSDNTNKPVGLCYIAVGLVDGGVSVYEYNLGGTRKDVTETAINLALFHAFKAIR